MGEFDDVNGVTRATTSVAVETLAVAPRVTIHFPRANALTDREDLVISGDVDGLTSLGQLDVNGRPATMGDTDASWHVRVPLDYGDNAFAVSATGTDSAFDPNLATRC